MLQDFVYLYQFQKNTWKSRSELEDIQSKKLRALIKHAYQNVRFYREAFIERNLHPDDIKTAHDLVKLPIVRKKVLQQLPQDFFAKNYNIKQCRKSRTSGSTGIPLTLYTSTTDESYNKTVNFRAMMENGLKLTHKVMAISHPESFTHKAWFQKIGIYRKENLSVYNSTERNVRKFVEYSPDLLIGYPSVLSVMADYITKNNIRITPTKKIFTSAEILFDGMRKKIVSIFGCDVIDLYGCTELRRLAWECSKHEGYHADIDFAVIEIIKDTFLEGEDGSILVTGLHNYAMPLIRYQNGDVAQVSQQERCSCGRGLPLIGKIKGRMDDMIILPSGRVISPRSINVLDYIEGINRYRIIQEEKGLFVVQIEKNERFSEQTLHDIEEQIRKGCFNEYVTIQIKEVEKIPQEKSGKIRTVISKVKLE